MAIKVPVSVGEQLTFSKTISDYDVYGFAGITGDFARNHVNEEYMSKHSPYGRRIAHGLLSLCMSSTVPLHLQRNQKSPVFRWDMTGYVS